MKNRNNTPIFCLIICVLMGINTLIGQNQPFKIGKIENWDSFIVLNELEKKRIEFEKESNKEFESPAYYVDSKYNYGLAGGRVESMDEMKATGKNILHLSIKEKRKLLRTGVRSGCREWPVFEVSSAKHEQATSQK